MCYFWMHLKQCRTWRKFSRLCRKKRETDNSVRDVIWRFPDPWSCWGLVNYRFPGPPAEFLDGSNKTHVTVPETALMQLIWASTSWSLRSTPSSLQDRWLGSWFSSLRNRDDLGRIWCGRAMVTKVQVLLRQLLSQVIFWWAGVSWVFSALVVNPGHSGSPISWTHTAQVSRKAQTEHRIPMGQVS